ncbi:MAG: hypothetical protein LW847_01540 [Burkholderiales bacterium]|jgi:hypothetical protein|nr:hypothetical protein [Burkholderiales bacterium]
MPDFALTALVYLPVIIGLVGTALAWRRVSRPVLFLVVSVLALLGIQAVIAPGVAWFLLGDFGNADAVAQQTYFRVVGMAAAVVLVAGTPLLWWLYRGLRRA